MPKSLKPVLGVRIGPASLAKLRQQAAAFEISLGELARRIIDEWIERRDQNRQEVHDTAIHP